LVAGVDLAQPTVSQHLKILVETGLARVRRQGREMRYELDADSLERLNVAIGEIGRTLTELSPAQAQPSRDARRSDRVAPGKDEGGASGFDLPTSLI
jgi:hypothetical protein